MVTRNSQEGRRREVGQVVVLNVSTKLMQRKQELPFRSFAYCKETYNQPLKNAGYTQPLGAWGSVVVKALRY